MPQHGVLVTEVEPSSSADSQGISPKSIITSINGANFDGPDDFIRQAKAAKGPVKLVVESPVSKGGLTEWKSQTIEITPTKPKKTPEGRP
jgi:S1-C subfamily serine protease